MQKKARNQSSNRKKQISQELESTVSAVIENRLSNGNFGDNVSKSQAAYLTTCEGLESIFVPIVSNLKLSFPKITKKYPDLLDCICKDLSYLLGRCQDGETFIFPGDPYAETGVKKRIPIQTVESAAFTISTFSHALDIFQSNNIDLPHQLKYKEAISAALVYLENAFCEDEKDGGYWPAVLGTKKEASIYFTWTVLETLVDFFETNYDAPLYKTSCEKLGGYAFKVRSWLERVKLPIMEIGDLSFALYAKKYKEIKVGSNPINSSLDELVHVEQVTNNDLQRELNTIIYESFYILIMLNLLWSEKRSSMAKFLRYLLPQLSSLLEMTPEAYYQVPGAKEPLEDFSIVPLALRGVAKVLVENERDPDFRGALDVINFDGVVSLCNKALNSKKLSSGLYAYDGETYEVYYTERVIEARVNFEESKLGITPGYPEWLRTAAGPHKYDKIKQGLKGLEKSVKDT